MKIFYMQLDRPMSSSSLDIRQFTLTLQFTHKDGAKKTKIAKCEGRIQQLERENHKYIYQVKYKPMSPLSDYMFQQYFLGKSIAPLYQVRKIWNSIIGHSGKAVLNGVGSKVSQWTTESISTNGTSKSQIS